MSGRTGAKRRKVQVREYSPVGIASTISGPSLPSTSSSAISPPSESTTLHTSRIRRLPGGQFRATNTVIGTSDPDILSHEGGLPPLVSSDSDDEDDELPWQDILGYGAEAEDLPYRIEQGDLPLEFMEDLEPRPTSGDQPLHEWLSLIDGYLATLLTLEGTCGSDTSRCPRCQDSENPGIPSFRCLSCDSPPLLCQKCIVETHREMPLHRINAWNGKFFERTSLKALGLRIQMGHHWPDQCPCPVAARGDDFVVIDTDQIHQVGLDFCGCGRTSEADYLQLLQRRLYPATSTYPKTAATFRVLEHFELLQYESKLSVYEFYQTIERLTVNTGLGVPNNRYNAFARMAHEWRHLKLLKRSGRGHDPHRSAQEANEGECGVLCPACPHPDINMPRGWEQEPEETRYIHALNLALDANFRLKRKDVSNDNADPGLSRGFAYFVEEKNFKTFLEAHMNEVEPKSTCSRHDAVNLADSRPGQGYSASGVATVECARHNMKRPSGVGDLQRGERYCNMDYLVNQSLRNSRLTTFYISYDIACQWSIRSFPRLSAIDTNMCLVKPGTKIRYLVPKFHLPAHIPKCRTHFAFMLTPGAGLGDGEAPERGWGDSNPLATSTREMGPGSRRDTLDCNFGDYNWRKITRLDTYLLRKLTNATTDLPGQVIAHEELEQVVDEEMLASWKAEMKAWEWDNKNTNPFDSKFEISTQDAVRLQLAEEEARSIDEGRDYSMDKDTSPSGLIGMALDLEAAQRDLKNDSKQVWEHSRDRQLGRFKLKSNALVRRIEDYYRKLGLYIPATVTCRKRSQTSKTMAAYDLQLWLPSQIGTSFPFDLDLARLEFRMREAQAREALATLRRSLQMRATFHDSKDRWVRGQRANTRARQAIESAQANINQARDEYRAARHALLSLSSLLSRPMDEGLMPLKDGDIRSMVSKETDQDGAARVFALSRALRPLADEDVRPIHEPAPGTVGITGETRKTLSWIWLQGQITEQRDSFNDDAIRIEWAKSAARAARYREEVKIVNEEMNRTIRFFEWKEDYWLKNGIAQDGRGLSPEALDGAKAYAQRQANLYHRLRVSFLERWKGVPDMIAEAYKMSDSPELWYAKKELEDKEKERARLKRLAAKRLP